MPFALIGRLHEGEEFEGFVSADGRLARLEKAGNLEAKFLITVRLACRHNAFGPKRDGTEFLLVPADATISAHPSPLPDAGQRVCIFGLNARDGLTSGAHEGKEHLDSMDAVKEHVRSSFLVGAGPPGVRADNLAQGFVLLQFLDVGAKTERRTRKTGNVPSFGQRVNRDSVGQGTGDRFVDE